MMKDSTVDPNWLREHMAKNPPSVRPNGNLFSGPVRLSFVNLFKPGRPSQEGGEGKFGCALLFPPGTDMSVFEKAAIAAAREKFPQSFDQQGKPVGLHFPFHDQAEKAYGAKPLAGYTPGAITFAVSSKYKPVVVDMNQNHITDENRVYAGVWAFVAMNLYAYGPPQPKKGVSFGLQTVMIIGDDQKLAAGGGNPQADFGAVTITAQSDVASKFDGAPQTSQPAAAGIMPGGGHMGTAGGMPTHALPGQEAEEERLMREMMG